MAAVITFDPVDEGSNNSRRGDLALGFQQRSHLQDAGIHPKATRSRRGSFWPLLASTFPPIVQLSARIPTAGWEAPCPPRGPPMGRVLHAEHAGDVMFEAHIQDYQISSA